MRFQPPPRMNGSKRILLGLAVALACGDRQPAPARSAEPRLQSTARAAQPDSELTNYINWYHDWKVLTNRHKAELDAAMREIAAKYSLADAYKVAEDPDLLALVARQRSEMAPLMSRAPRGLTAQALDATLPGIGRLVIGPRGMTYVPGRDEAVLAAARAKYGEEFVNWVLTHEAVIHATLGADQ